MKPIQISVVGKTALTPKQVCAEFLRTERWPEFKGYSILPGIRSACYELRNPDHIGSRIRVRNTDDSSHVEEIIEWNPHERIALRFQEFTSPLDKIADLFIERLEFRILPDGTEITRSMVMLARNLLGWLVLLPVSRLMKKALELNASQFADQ